MKFDFKFFNHKIEFLDTSTKNSNSNRFQPTLYEKRIDSQHYLYKSSAHPLPFKKSIPYSEALKIKRVCSTSDEYKKHSNDLIKRFVEKRYKKDIMRNKIKKVDYLERSALLIKTNAVLKSVILFFVT